MSLRVILASAGAGKTQRLATLAIEALRSSQGSQGVLAITFTRNAAAELRSRILLLLSQNDPSLLRKVILGQAILHTSTIDALTRELYQHTAPLLGLAVYSNLVVEVEDQIEVSAQLTRQLLARLHRPEVWQALRETLLGELERTSRRLSPKRIIARQIRRQIEEGLLRLHNRLLVSAWLRSLTPQERQAEAAWVQAFSVDTTEDALVAVVHALLKEYRQEHRRLFLRDIVTVVQLAARHLPELLGEKTALYTDIFVDEAQDTAPQQWEILAPLFEELRARGGCVTLIGDPKQAIYAWRGADFRQLMRFWEQADYPESLTENFRSYPQIIEFNNTLYKQLPGLLEGVLKSKDRPYRKQAVEILKRIYTADSVQQQPGHPMSGDSASAKVQVCRISCDTPEEWAKTLKSLLTELEKQGIRPEETAFLVRRNEDIQELFSLLPTFPLQLRSLPLGKCASLELTFRLLGDRGETSVERRFLKLSLSDAERQHFSHLLEAVRFQSVGSSPLERWTKLEAVGRFWGEQRRPQDRPFWKLFLSQVYTLLIQHPFYGVPELVRWWEERGRHIELELPPMAGTYVVSTIHKAKGLAWDAVIIPFADWSLLSATWRGPKWRNVPINALPASLKNLYEQQHPVSFQSAYVELPIQVSSKESNPHLAAVYNEFFVENTIENLNLHYVSTTRPRRFLYILVPPPSSARKGENSWAGFWAEESLGRPISRAYE